MNDIATQYRIIISGSDGIGWITRSDRGRLRFDGVDRISYLQALLTNDVAGLAPGAGTLALYLTPQGRTIADLHVFVLPDHVLADVPASSTVRLAMALDGLIFTEDVRVTDVSDAIRQISVVGPRAATALAEITGATESTLKELPVWSHVPAPQGMVVRTDDRIVDKRDKRDSWDLLVDQSEMPRVLKVLERHGAIPVSDALAEALRIEAGRPRFGVDFTEETIPLEAGLLDRAISRTKGCYVGQEVIIRVLDRGAGRIAKRLVRLSVDSSSGEPPIHARVVVDGRDVGRLTSVAQSPTSDGFIALGYVAREAADQNRVVTLSWDDRTATARITGFAG